jgi:hypothetical protein
MLRTEEEKKDDEEFENYYLNTMPELTEEESKKAMEETNKCADYIHKNGLTPNLDSIY